RVFGVDGEWRNGRRPAVLDLPEPVASENLVPAAQTMVGAAEVVIVRHRLTESRNVVARRIARVVRRRPERAHSPRERADAGRWYDCPRKWDRGEWIVNGLAEG